MPFSPSDGVAYPTPPTGLYVQRPEDGNGPVHTPATAVVPAAVQVLIMGVSVPVNVRGENRGSAHSSTPVVPLSAYILSAPT